MSSEDDDPLTNAPGPEDQREEPIRELAAQELEPSSDFWARIRRRIYRRETGSQLISYSWNLPGVVLKELVNVLRHLFLASGGRKEQ